LTRLERELDRTGVADGDRTFNLTWHDWLNLKSLLLVSRAVTAAALQRENSRGAHFREDYPEPGALDASQFTCVQLRQDALEVSSRPVVFTRVQPGQSLLQD